MLVLASLCVMSLFDYYYYYFHIIRLGFKPTPLAMLSETVRLTPAGAQPRIPGILSGLGLCCCCIQQTQGRGLMGAERAGYLGPPAALFCGSLLE